MTQPSIILVSPQMGENIGAAARVMANFGLRDLRIVSPRDGWPNPAADTMSAGAFEWGVDARVFDSVEAATADLRFVLATTARPRGMEKPVHDAESGANALARHLSPDQAQGSGDCVLGGGVPGAGVLFGAEKSGLPNEAVALADAILTYPVDRSFSSLNLAQAVGVFAHAWATRADLATEASATDGSFGGVGAPASRDELVGMMEHFEEELERAGFFFPPEKKPVVTQNLRNAFTRAGWTPHEVRAFRGAIKALALGRGKARVARDD